MNQAPHIVNGYRTTCPCGADLEVGACADGLPGAAHAEPLCLRFIELDPTAYLLWLHGARMSMSSTTNARIERAGWTGRQPQ